MRRATAFSQSPDAPWRMPLDTLLAGVTKRHNGRRSGNQLQHTLSDLERALLERDGERAYFLDAAGNVLLERDGDLDEVNFSDDDLDGAAPHTITHNHVEGDALSVDDVALASEEDAQQVRAVGRAPDGKVYLYVVNRPASGWGDIADRLPELYARWLPAARAKFRGTNASDAEMSQDFWKFVKAETGVDYRMSFYSN